MLYPQDNLAALEGSYSEAHRSTELDFCLQERQGSSKELPAFVRGNAEVVRALEMRKVIQGTNLTELDSWDFNVFDLSNDQLIACVCQMFMQQGLCQSKVVS